MAIGKALRDNPALAIGIALPLAVVLLFVAASTVPKLFVAPPQHDFLLRVNGPPRTVRPVVVEVDVAGGRLRARVFNIESERLGDLYVPRQPTPRLFLWDHERQALREIEIAIPDDAESLPDGTEISLGELDGRRISTSLTAPDGYEYRTRDSFDAGWFGALFGGPGRRVVVAKNGVRIATPVPEEQMAYWNTEFVGWLVD